MPKEDDMKIKHFQAYACVILLALATASPSVRASPPQEANRPTVAGDEFWANPFNLGIYYSSQPNLTAVFSIAVNGTDVYIGGYFDHAGNVASNHIAKWDSVAHRWSALGSGVSSVVYAIAVHGDDVYVGGVFTTAGGISVTGIARWNDTTQTWSAVGGALERTLYDPIVTAIAIGASGDVYVGGNFEKAGGVTVNNIARWDGSSWHALGSGTGGTHPDVDAIAISGSDVYIGGSFTTVNGIGRNYVARWNGSAWSGLGSGTNEAVTAIAIDGSNVYVGSAFTTVTDSGGDHTVGNVAMWNGSSWSTMDGGVGNTVWALAVGPDGLYVGGNFQTLAGGIGSIQRLARWDGSNWHALDGGALLGSDGVDNTVSALAVMGDEVYFGGWMNSSNTGRAFNHIGYWDANDAEWYALGNSPNDTVYAIAFQGDDVYLGGSFTSAGGVKTPGIARWNPHTGEWAQVGGGVSGCTGISMAGCTPTVYTLLVDGDDIYVGGNFTHVGGQAANGIARWNVVSQTWYIMGDGVTCSGFGCSAYVRALAKDSDKLYLGGDFDFAGGSLNQANNIAAWNIYGYATMGGGTNGTVYAIQVVDSSVYIGGSFTSPANYVAYWQGGWNAVGNGLNSAVRALTWQSGLYLYLLVGGTFTDAGGNSNADHIAVLLGPSWGSLGDGLDSYVYALNWNGESLYAGGSFTASGITGMNRIGRWSSNNWSGLGSGTDDTVYAVAYHQGKVYAGGVFQNAGGKPSFFFGRWGPDNVYLPLVVR
jgi:hypothetical protein